MPKKRLETRVEKLEIDQALKEQAANNIDIEAIRRSILERLSRPVYEPTDPPDKNQGKGG